LFLLISQNNTIFVSKNEDMGKIDWKGIKNVIFDLGGVILDIAPQRTVEKMKELGIQNFDLLYSQLKQNETFDLLEKGDLSEDQFVYEILKHTDKPIAKTDIIEAWNALLLDFKADRIDLISRLNDSDRFQTFLLSNTNGIHKKTYNEDLFRQYAKRLEDLFKAAYFSHEIGMRKPDHEIFRFVIEQEQLNPAETLFIDDSRANITAAAEVGLATCHIANGFTITDLFGEQLIAKQI